MWESAIAIGEFTIIAGDAGLGKTTTTLDIAARVTTGADFPDGSPAAAGEVAILSDEDSADDTIGPRLMAAGADLEKVHDIDGLLQCSDGRSRFLNFGVYMEAVEEMVQPWPDLKLLVIDPISSYLGDSDSHQNAAMRAILAPLCNRPRSTDLRSCRSRI